MFLACGKLVIRIYKPAQQTPKDVKPNLSKVVPTGKERGRNTSASPGGGPWAQGPASH